MLSVLPALFKFNKEVQYKKQFVEIDVIPEPNVIDVKLLQRSNALSPISKTESLIINVVKLIQYEKAFEPIVVKLLVILHSPFILLLKVFKFVFVKKVLVGIIVTLFGNYIFSNA